MGFKFKRLIKQLDNPVVRSLVQVGATGLGIPPSVSQAAFTAWDAVRGVNPNASGIQRSPFNASQFSPESLPTASNPNDVNPSQYPRYSSPYTPSRPMTPRSPYPPSPYVGSGATRNPYYRPQRQQFSPSYGRSASMFSQRGGGSRMNLYSAGGY